MAFKGSPRIGTRDFVHEAPLLNALDEGRPHPCCDLKLLLSDPERGDPTALPCGGRDGVRPSQDCIHTEQLACRHLSAHCVPRSISDGRAWQQQHRNHCPLPSSTEAGWPATCPHAVPCCGGLSSTEAMQAGSVHQAAKLGHPHTTVTLLCLAPGGTSPAEACSPSQPKQAGSGCQVTALVHQLPPHTPPGLPVTSCLHSCTLCVKSSRLAA